jgi:xanthine dehydrogenase accessory factor
MITLVGVQGSSYRQPGARLLLSSDGRYEGAISGGCLEVDVLRKTSWLTREGAALERYSTLLDETTEMPFGLGCGASSISSSSLSKPQSARHFSVHSNRPFQIANISW